MLIRLRNSKAQSITEYAVLLGVVVGALIAMQVYVKRGLQGRVRDLADQISPTHYESGQTDSQYMTVQSGTVAETYSQGISRRYQDGTNNSTAETMVKNGSETTYPEEAD
jgi:gas vesicle protein